MPCGGLGLYESFGLSCACVYAYIPIFNSHDIKLINIAVSVGTTVLSLLNEFLKKGSRPRD